MPPNVEGRSGGKGRKFGFIDLCGVDTKMKPSSQNPVIPFYLRTIEEFLRTHADSDGANG